MWQIQFPRGWYDIDQDVQARISSASPAGYPTVEFATVKSQRLGLYRRYMIDFGRLQQRNLKSGRIRAVRLLQTTPDAQPGTSEATGANTCNNVTAATLMIEDDTRPAVATLAVTRSPMAEHLLSPRQMQNLGLQR